MYLGGVIEDSGFGLGDGGLVISGEEDKFINVLGKSFLVSVETFLTSVFAAVIDGDTDRSGELNAKPGGFDFVEGES